MMRTLAGIVLAFVLAAPASAQVATDPACPATTPAAMQLAGVPAVAVPGRSYEVALTPTGAGDADGSHGSTLGVSDSTGRGWSAHYQYLTGVRQAFSVGLRGAPFTVTGSYSEPLDSGGTCTRTLLAPLPIVRLIYAVVNCRRGAIAPRSGIVFFCAGERLRLRDMRWRDWNADATTGRGRLGREHVAVTLSSPRECSTIDGFSYTRAEIRSGGRTRRYAIACPLTPAA